MRIPCAAQNWISNPRFLICPAREHHNGGRSESLNWNEIAKPSRLSVLNLITNCCSQNRCHCFLLEKKRSKNICRPINTARSQKSRDGEGVRVFCRAAAALQNARNQLFSNPSELLRPSYCSAGNQHWNRIGKVKIKMGFRPVPNPGQSPQ